MKNDKCVPLLLAGMLLHIAAAEAGSSAAFSVARDGSVPAAVVDLNGKWQFKAADDVVWLDAQVPGSVHSDLIGNGRLEDPFYRDNELKSQWMEDRDWEYRRSFEISRDFLAHHRITLECRGLDTIAEVRLNGILAASTTNMFIEHELEAKPLLKVGRNELHILFRPILRWIQSQKAADPRVSTLCPEGHPNNDCRKGLLFLARKEASDFGWDWSPRTVTCGIWKPVRIAAYDAGRIAGVLVRQKLVNSKEAELSATADIEAFGGADLDLELQLFFENRLIAAEAAPVAGHQARVALQVRNPRIWWPNGLGDQPLYTVVANLREAGRIVHSRSHRIGIRTVELVREPDERGESFGFRVNGHPVFCKGANWVPLDALPERISEDRYRRILRAAVEANMNMLRVWGGGLYEADAFYDYCDENGIMLWHDFMFATGPYIAVPAYLENVRREIENVVRRRRHHPSIVLWCGNNEQESSMSGGQQWLRDYKAVTWADYDKVFHDVIPRTAALNDPDRPYWPGSPHHPLDRERRTEAWETSSGDAHDWEVWHEGRSFEWFNELRRLRFVSEFGFESLPHLETIRSFTLPADRYMNSYILEHHEKTGLMTREGIRTGGHNRGTSRIARYAASLFGMPGSLEEWIYVSQILQAEGMRLAVEGLRRNFPDSTGALYWQLGDNWPAVSNSSIDYYTRWKALQYMARRFFSPVLASCRVQGTSVTIRGINDHLSKRPAVLQWRLARFDGGEVRRGESRVTLDANRSCPIAELSFSTEVGEEPGFRTYRNESFANSGRYYFWYRLAGEGGEYSSNAAFFAPYKYLQLHDPGFETEITRDGDRLVVSIAARKFAAFVELGLLDGYARFSDNYFHLPPGEVRKIEVLDSNLAPGALKSRLCIRSLADLLPPESHPLP